MSSVPPPIPYQPKRTRIDIFSAVLRARREFGGSKIAIVDGDERELSYNEIVRAAFALGSAIKKRTRKGESIGIMLPTGAGAVIAFLSVLAAGRVPAMLNFTAGAANLKSAMKAAQVSKVLTAHRFVELGSLEPLVESLESVADIISLEDVREGLKLGDKIAGALGPVF